MTMNLGVHDESQHLTFEAEESDPQSGKPCVPADTASSFHGRPAEQFLQPIIAFRFDCWLGIELPLKRGHALAADPHFLRSAFHKIDTTRIVRVGWGGVPPRSWQLGSR